MNEIDHVRDQLRAIAEQQRQVRAAMFETLEDITDLRQQDISLQARYDELFNQFNHLRDEAANN